MSLKPYPEYKDSGIGWLGEVPMAWKVVPLWRLFQRSKRLGTGREELLSVYRDYGVIPKVSRADNFNKPSEDLSKYQVVETGDLVINKMKAWQGSVAVSDHSGIVSPAYFVFKRLQTMNLRFMHYLMRSIPYFQHYASISTGVRPNQWDLDPSRHRVMGVLFPTLQEQQQIADYLDRETAEIDAFIADQGELILLLNERRATTITQAVTKGLDPNASKKDSGVVWLGDIPSRWDVVKLGWYSNCSSGKPISGEDVEAVEDSTNVYPVIGGNGGMGFCKSVNVTRPVLVVGRVGALCGNVHLVNEPVWVTDNALRLRVEDTFDLRYLVHLLRARNLNSLADKTAQPLITGTLVSRQRLPMPSLDTQQEIAEFLERETAQIDATISDARQAIALSKERRAALISAAVTGKIDVRDAVEAKQHTVKVKGESVGVA